MANKYSQEFDYTDNHVSLLRNEFYSVIIYKNKECINELSLENPTVDFSECIKKLKQDNIIDDKDKLVILQITKITKDIKNNNLNLLSMYEPNSGTIIPINELCKNEPLIMQENLLAKLNKTSIDIDSLLFFTNQNINVFNLSSEFYNDICYHFDSPIDKDITLKDRIKLYYPNITLCESGCKLKGVNLTTLKALCECKLIDIMNNNIFEDNLLFQSQFGELKDLISKTNIEVLKCYKDLFAPKYFLSCIGGFFVLILIIIQIVMAIIFFNRSILLIRKYLFGITGRYIMYLSSNLINNSNPPKKKRKRKIALKETSRNDIIKVSKQSNNNNKLITETWNKKMKYEDIIINEKNGDNNNFASSKNMPSASLLSSRINLKNKQKNQKSYSNFKKDNKQLTNENNQFIFMNYATHNDVDINEYLCTEYDDMDYEDSIKKDKRKFCQYFKDKLKINQIILNTFLTKEPLRPITIKILLFVLDIDLYLLINAMFFNEDYISEVFHSTKKENFFTFIPRSYSRFFYTTLVGVIVNYIIDFFFIEEKKIKGIFKREKDNLFVLKYEVSKISKVIKKRYILFIILSFIITTFTLYYIFCLHSVYPHMRNEWIKSSIIIIIIMQILTVLECLLETILRFISFKCKSEKIYKLSLMLS